MRVLENLEPKKVFEYFEEICSIPHGSRDTKRISDYLVQFAVDHGFTYYQDEMNNVIIIAEATEGYENAEPIIMQGHMDMVCEKENDVTIDFEKDGLNLYVDGDFVKAKGTTLGGDDGVAIAYALAILDSKEIKRPRLEVVITVDEEIGMLGAEGIDLSMLKGHTMLNIDSDEEGFFLTSCAGGMSVEASIPVKRTQMEGSKMNLLITGLEGGHSGAEIHKEHGNADILMGRLLDLITEAGPCGIVNLNGGLKDNAIARECSCDILVPTEMVPVVQTICKNLEANLKTELSVSDPNVVIGVTDLGTAKEAILDYSSTEKVVFYLRSVPNGVMNMSRTMEGFVETSLNLGIMNLHQDSLDMVTSIRSCVPSRKEDLKNRVVKLVEMLGGEVTITGDYPAWVYKEESPLREAVDKIYTELFGEKPVFQTIHAGLECGIFSDKIKDLDCVSFGPNNYDIHTPKERLSISSTKRYWDFLVAFLENAK